MKKIKKGDRVMSIKLLINGIYKSDDIYEVRVYNKRTNKIYFLDFARYEQISERYSIHREFSTNNILMRAKKYLMGGES